MKKSEKGKWGKGARDNFAVSGSAQGRCPMALRNNRDHRPFVAVIDGLLNLPAIRQKKRCQGQFSKDNAACKLSLTPFFAELVGEFAQA